MFRTLDQGKVIGAYCMRRMAALTYRSSGAQHGGSFHAP
jgi:hypothetical protein